MIQEKVIPEVEGIIPPDPVSFWPPQPGWYVVMVVLLALLIWLIVKMMKKYRRNAYRRMGYQQLEDLKSAEVDQASLIQLNNLLKAASIEAYSREEVASLSGSKWAEFLSSSCKTDPFTPEHKNLISKGSFDQSLIENTKPESWQILLVSSQKWMKTHRS
ncbi:DUF4381 domain-containing protein [Aureitalea marina]|uniref:DUF4381 domain-containing protein n=1 Tax=Aureitalea marina TaxID=930804 RepID=A0A2S7KSH1_9FLAO|nr:DUF4381 domain-containing protein [Aureitalea marina]PQB05579.1 hypothetical protein BST85_12225 [Aureitalea marina]